MREFHYRWEWDLRAPPEAIWNFVADTNRFNRDSGLPEIQRLQVQGMKQRLALTLLGMKVEWDEYPFEWIRPHRFSILRRYHTGPIGEIHATVELTGIAGGGTHVLYDVIAKPRTFLGRFVIPIRVGIQTRRDIDRVLRDYDRLAAEGRDFFSTEGPVELAPKGNERLRERAAEMRSQGATEDLVNRLVQLVERSDDLTLSRLRPFVLADHWGAPRRDVLELCLRAVRAGMLDCRWDMICPLCRGAKKTAATLGELDEQGQCDACQVTFRPTFDRSVEVTFRPNAAVRPILSREFCIGGPELTPHIVAQQRVPPDEERLVNPRFQPGPHRVRAAGLEGSWPFRVVTGGPIQEAEVTLLSGWSGPAEIAPEAALRLRNSSGQERLFIVERADWTEAAATAADVTTLQIFRDLFSRDVLRPDVRLGIETLAMLFTDLRDSTKLYREIGDAPAFGKVLNHFDILRESIAKTEGSIVKTMGDAVMAVFGRPSRGIRAFVDAVRELRVRGGSPPLVLKGGLHVGPALAVNLNDRLDYFGSTINMAARLENLAHSNEIVVSGAVAADPEVATLLAKDGLSVETFQTEIRGFEGQTFPLLRIRIP